MLLGLGVTLIAFVLTHLVPGDPAEANLGQRAGSDPVAVQVFREHYGLDKPLPVQYVVYLTNLLHGDMGESEQSRRPVRADLGEYIPATAELALTSIVLSGVLGSVWGCWPPCAATSSPTRCCASCRWPGCRCPRSGWRWWRCTCSSINSSWCRAAVGWTQGYRSRPTSAACLPSTRCSAAAWISLSNALQHLILPSCVLAAFNMGLFTRFTRSAVLEVLDNDYVRTARAKGLSERAVIFGHVLRAASPPVITVIGLAFGNVMTGTVLVENIFSWPGIGQYSFRSATTLDLPAIVGVMLFVALVYTLANLVVDVLYGVIDPRVRLT